MGGRVILTTRESCGNDGGGPTLFCYLRESISIIGMLFA